MALSPFFKKYLFIWLHQVCLGALVAQRVKWLPEMQEIRVRSLGHEDPLEKEVAAHSSTPAWKISWTEEPGRLSPWGCKESDTTEQLQFHQVLVEVGEIFSCSM